MSKNLYMVPYDFTPTSRRALDYALYIAKYVQTEIKILHLASNEKNKIEMQSKLDVLSKELVVPTGVDISTLVVVGSIFTDISRIAKEEKVQLIVMGTHGKRGIKQRLFGSHAMKVITSVECPFLVVQKDTEIRPIKNIAVPIDLTKESLQIANVAGDLAHIVNADLHILAEKQTDDILNTRLKNRISIVTNEYKDRDVNATVEFVKKRGKYERKVISYSKSNHIDLIALAYHSESILPQLDTFAQNLITNKLGVPVLIVNSKLASALYF